MTKIKGMHNLRPPQKTRMYKGRKVSFVSRDIYTTLKAFTGASSQKVKQHGKKYNFVIAIRQDVIENKKVYYVLDIYALTQF